MATYIFDTKLVDKAISGIRNLKLAELKARREISWRLDNSNRSHVVAYYKEMGRGFGVAIDLDLMTEDGYSDTKNIGLATVGTPIATSSSSEKAFESVKQTALRRLEVLKRQGII